MALDRQTLVWAASILAMLGDDGIAVRPTHRGYPHSDWYGWIVQGYAASRLVYWLDVLGRQYGPGWPDDPAALAQFRDVLANLEKIIDQHLNPPPKRWDAALIWGHGQGVVQYCGGGLDKCPENFSSFEKALAASSTLPPWRLRSQGGAPELRNELVSKARSELEALDFDEPGRFALALGSAVSAVRAELVDGSIGPGPSSSSSGAGPVLVAAGIALVLAMRR